MATKEQPKSPTHPGVNAAREAAIRGAAAHAEGRPTPRTPQDPPVQSDSGHWWHGDTEHSGTPHGYEGVSGTDKSKE